MRSRIRMAIIDTAWRNFLLPDSDIPTDVCFLVKEVDGVESIDKSIRAHKLLLAGSSPVFRAQFFGPLQETEGVVEVKNTSTEAFGTMIRYIYRSPGEEPFTLDAVSSCPQKLMEVHELAERYQILSLKAITAVALDTLAITRENMIFTAPIARAYKNMFEETCTKLQMKCLKYLYDTNSSGRILSLIQQTKESFPEVDLNILYELINVGHKELGLTGIFEPKQCVALNLFNLFQGGGGSSSLTWTNVYLVSK